MALANRKNPNGRPRNTAAREELQNRRPDRRNSLPAPIEDGAPVVEPLSGKPPSDLKKDGRTLWNAICYQMAAHVAAGLMPTATMTDIQDVHSLCSAHDRLCATRRAIKKMESEWPAKDRDMAQFNVDDKGEMTLKKIYIEEMKLAAALASASNTLGLNKKAAPLVSISLADRQEERVMKQVNDPDSNLIAFNRAGKEIIDATVEEVD